MGSQEEGRRYKCESDLEDLSRQRRFHFVSVVLVG